MPNDGDGSGIPGDNPCAGQVTGCDDNCTDVPNGDCDADPAACDADGNGTVTSEERGWGWQADSDGDGQGDACDDGTFVELLSFEGHPSSGRVELVWVTEYEIDNEGFQIYRREAGTVEEPYPLLDRPIPAQGDEFAGSTYRWVDETVTDGVLYEYVLEDIDLRGLRTRHGPVQAVPNPQHPPVRLVAPLYDAVLQRLRLDVFRWQPPETGSVLLEFSADPRFPADGTIRARPGDGEIRVRLLARARGLMYWRLVDRAEPEQVASQTWRFVVERVRPNLQRPDRRKVRKEGSDANPGP